MSASHL